MFFLSQHTANWTIPVQYKQCKLLLFFNRLQLCLRRPRLLSERSARPFAAQIKAEQNRSSNKFQLLTFLKEEDSDNSAAPEENLAFDTHWLDSGFRNLSGYNQSLWIQIHWIWIRDFIPIWIQIRSITINFERKKSK